MFIGVIALVVIGGTLMALALARAAAIGDEANAFRKRPRRRHWWEW